MTILAAVGEEQPSSQTVPVGYDLATTHDETLLVLHVIPEEEFNEHRKAIRGTPGYEHFTISQEEQSGAEFAHQVVEQSLDEFDSERIETRGRVGNPAEKILAEAAHTDPSYLVVGATKRSPVGKALFGSTTQRVLLNATCPVVTTVRDED